MRLLLACLIAATAFAAQAQSNGVYKWKDAKGVTHYSDTPPPSGRYGSVVTDAPPPKSALPVKQDARCADARANVERIKGSPGEIGPDANRDGKPDSVLDASQRARYLKAAEDQVVKFCAPSKQ